MKVFAMIFALAAGTACALAETPPRITNQDGHVFVTTNGVVQNVTDLLSSKTAVPLFQAQEKIIQQVERRSEGNVVDLLNELKEGSTANTDALNQGFSLIASLLAAAANDTKKAQAEAQASVGQDPLLSEQIYWLALDQARVSTNEAATKLNFVGIGFEAYFNPLFPSFFKCTYTDAKNNKVETAGRVVSAEDKIAYFSIVCDSPSFVAAKTEYTASLSYQDADGVKSIPFKGVKGRNVVAFSMVWTTATFVGPELILDVSGLDSKAKYLCEFTDAVNSKIKKTQAAKFAGSNYKLSCGNVPTGFTIQSEKATSKIFLKVSVSGSSNQVVYAGKASNAVHLPMCLNGVKDGSESDTDCGGACGPTCAQKKKCTRDADCGGGGACNPTKKVCGGGPGTSEQRPGDSCKQIKRDYNSKNGRYWIRGFGAGRLQSAFKVYCWMQERDGGGWSLIQSNWYSSGKVGLQQNDYGDVDNSRLFHSKGHHYKLADTKIRASIGQSQKTGEQSSFDLMGDQGGLNTYYSSVNIEHAILYNYKADWFSTSNYNRNEPMKESSTKTEMKIFLLRSGARSNPNTPGVGGNKADGEVSWTGRPKCGSRGKTGVNCYGAYSGSPRTNPSGGTGCKFRRDNRRWNGQLHFYMAETNSNTYMYLCNGPQHSSGFNMNHRWWIRSAKGSADE